MDDPREEYRAAVDRVNRTTDAEIDKAIDRLDVLITFRVEPDLRDRICAAAARDGRPVSNWVRKVLLDWLQDQGS